MDKDQLDNAIEWVNEGKSLDNWLRVNGYTDNKEEAQIEIEAALSDSTLTSKPEVKDDLDIIEDELIAEEDEDEEDDYEDED